MSDVLKIPIVCIDKIEPLEDDENVQNIIHAIPVDNEAQNVIFMVPEITIEQDDRNRQYKYRLVSLSVVLCCFSIFFITVSIVTKVDQNVYSNAAASSNISSEISLIKVFNFPRFF